jgi:hypothetical protein
MVWHPKHVDNVLAFITQKVLGIAIELMENTAIMWTCTND